MLSLFRNYLSLTALSSRNLAILTLMAIVGGSVNVMLVALITEALRHDKGHSVSWLGVGFAVGSVVFLLSQEYIQTRVAHLSEEAAAAIRRRLVAAFSGAALLSSEQTPHHAKQAALGRDTAIMASALSSLIAFVASLTTVVAGIAYMVALSPVAALVFCLVIALAVAFYQGAVKALTDALSQAYLSNDHFFRFAEDLAHGQKELKLDGVWASYFVQNDVLGTLSQSARQLGEVKARQQRIGHVATIAFLLLIGSATFLPDLHIGFDINVATGFVLTLLFLQVPIHNAVMRLPALGEATVSMRRIQTLLDGLHTQAEVSLAVDAGGLPGWRVLRLEGVTFSYAVESGKNILKGVDLEIHRGETVFIVGGNGSGKTTLAKIITGLYRPTQGRLLLDGVEMRPSDMGAYRNQFGAVFSDAHLFARGLAGLDEDGVVRMQEVLSELALVPSRSADGRFDPKALSQGQKKRLALAFAMSTDRPVLFFDEWTADQDPEFRAYFYEIFLPRLKREGKTVFVISHDDRYFQWADVLLKLDAGCLHEVRKPSRAAIDIEAADAA